MPAEYTFTVGMLPWFWALKFGLVWCNAPVVWDKPCRSTGRQGKERFPDSLGVFSGASPLIARSKPASSATAAATGRLHPWPMSTWSWTLRPSFRWPGCCSRRTGCAGLNLGSKTSVHALIRATVQERAPAKDLSSTCSPCIFFLLAAPGRCEAPGMAAARRSWSAQLTRRLRVSGAQLDSRRTRVWVTADVAASAGFRQWRRPPCRSVRTGEWHVSCSIAASPALYPDFLA